MQITDIATKRVWLVLWLINSNYKYFTKLEMRLWLNSLIVIYVSVSRNMYLHNMIIILYRNTFGWLVGLSYKVAKFDILIISLVYRW